MFTEKRNLYELNYELGSKLSRLSVPKRADSYFNINPTFPQVFTY